MRPPVIEFGLELSTADLQRDGVLRSVGNLAHLNLATGRVGEAEANFVEALRINRACGHRRSEGLHSCDYALCLLVLGRAEARETWRKGAETLNTIGDPTLVKQQVTAMHEACAKAGVPPFDE